MSTSHINKILTAASVFSLSAAPLQSQIEISNWDITGQTLSFDISGTLSGATPDNNVDTLWITPTPFDTSIINTSEMPTVVSNTISIVGNPGAGNPTLSTQDSGTLGDGIFLTWGFDLVAGTEVTGSYSGTFFSAFTANVWDSQESLDLYWGRDTTIDTGTFQSVVVSSVPEASTYAYLASILGLVLLGRKWIKRK